MPYEPRDLSPIEIALLGVLSTGLPPSRAAGSDTFRTDHVTAVTVALQDGKDHAAHLMPDGLTITPGFRAELKQAILDLQAKGIVTYQEVGMPAAAGGYDEGLAIDMVNPDEHPILLDRFLGQVCMEMLFNIQAVYPYLMGRYAASGEVWRRLREGGYASD